jgi:DNA primase
LSVSGRVRAAAGFSINTRKHVFNCRGCGTGGDVIELVQFLDDCGFPEACKNRRDAERRCGI